MGKVRMCAVFSFHWSPLLRTADTFRLDIELNIYIEYIELKKSADKLHQSISRMGKS